MTARPRPIVAIDGPAGAGKSTVAKRVAAALGYRYIDTGAMYRAVTLKVIREGRDPADRTSVEEAARRGRIEFVPGETGTVLLDGRDVSRDLRTPEVSRLVSAHVASYPGVREVLVARQREMGAEGGIVMEGRDITTVVFPDAEIQVYLTASREERARRRHAELAGRGVPQPYAELLADLERRDREDRERPGGALRRSERAVCLDTTGMPLDAVVTRVADLARRRQKPVRMRFLFALSIWFVRSLFKLFFRLRIEGAEHLPERGGFILASNHASYLDPPLLGASLIKRELHFLARSTLFRNACFGRLIAWYNAHPIERGRGPFQDWEAFKRILEADHALLVFPEGTRSPDGLLQRGRSGFGRLVYETRRPVIPAYIRGAYEALPKRGGLRFAPITVRFGPPVPLDDLWALGGEKRTLRAIAQRTMEAIAALGGVDQPATRGGRRADPSRS